MGHDKITTVTFDLWQTLIQDNPERGQARSRLRIQGTVDALLGEDLDFSYRQVQEAYHRCVQACQDIRAQERDVSFEEQVGIYLKAIEPGLGGRLALETVERISTVYRDSFFQHPPLLMEGAAVVLRGLRRRGYRLGLISNTGQTPGAAFRMYLQHNGILDSFDTMTFSDEVRLAKPARRMFLDTLERLGTPPAEAVHVGDHLLNDVTGAKRAGMRAVWLQGFDDGEVVEAPDAVIQGLGQLEGVLKHLG